MVARFALPTLQTGLLPPTCDEKARGFRPRRSGNPTCALKTDLGQARDRRAIPTVDFLLHHFRPAGKKRAVKTLQCKRPTIAATPHTAKLERDLVTPNHPLRDSI
jgi:hypothetical protein